MINIVWSYGITAVPSRMDRLLPRTISSLADGGFGRPHLFIDGEPVHGLPSDYHYTVRSPNVFTATTWGGRPCGSSAGPWALALYELYLRNPWADRYAIFQDDCVTYRNLKAYLERFELKPKTYWNLFTNPFNQRKSKDAYGWQPSNQLGRGAVGLVFDREGVVDLLSSREWMLRPQNREKGHKSVDGGIQNTLVERCGYTELIHNPSLLQHIGDVSSMGNNPHLPAKNFMGEDYDALNLLKQ